jgi:polynucleotide 5'-kinase involved in rRNA processing
MNRHPTVGYVDTDLGQPELSPPGVVSTSLLTSPLLGGPLVEQRLTWDQAYFLGDVSPAIDPTAYHAAVSKLVTRAPEDMGRVPLVINTHGWVKVGVAVGRLLLHPILHSSTFHPSPNCVPSAYAFLLRLSSPTLPLTHTPLRI